MINTEKLKQEIIFLKKISSNLFLEINKWRKETKEEKEETVFNLYIRMLEIIDDIFYALSKNHHYTAGTLSATLIEALGIFLYINGNIDHLNDFENFYFVDSLYFTKDVSKIDLEKIKRFLLPNKTDNYNRKSYQQYFFKKGISKMLEEQYIVIHDESAQFGKILYDNYHYFCNYKHLSPYILGRKIVEDDQDIYNVIFFSLLLIQLKINEYFTLKFDIDPYYKEYLEEMPNFLKN